MRASSRDSRRTADPRTARDPGRISRMCAGCALAALTLAAGAWALLRRQWSRNSQWKRSPRTVRTARCSAACILSGTPDSGVVHGEREVSRQQGRAVREGLVGRRDARASRAPARAAGPRRGRRARAGELGRGARACRRALAKVQAQYGRDAVGVFGGGSLTNEKAYLLGKFARVALGTANIDYNGRFCMSSAAAAATRAFGIDRGLPFPLEDIAKASVVLLVGANPGRDDAADHAVLRGAAGRRRRVDRRRSAADGDRALGRAAICASGREPTPRSPTACCTC